MLLSTITTLRHGAFVDANRPVPSTITTELQTGALKSRAPELEKAFANFRNLNTNERDVTNSISQGAMTSLEFVSSLLHGKSNVREADNDELLRLVEMLESVHADLDAADIDDALKHFVFFHLDEMLGAARAAKFVGPRVLQRAAERAIGASVLRAGEFAAHEHEPAVGRFKGALGTIALSLGIAASGTSIAATVVPALMEGESDEPQKTIFVVDADVDVDVDVDVVHSSATPNPPRHIPKSD